MTTTPTPRTATTEYDVAIAGGGPVGLFLACELGLSGRSVLVLERETEPDSPWRTAPLGRRGLTARSIEALDRRDLLRPLLAGAGLPGIADRAPWARQRSVGHLAGIRLDPDLVDADALPYHLSGRLPESLLVSLDVIEATLATRARELGVTIRRGATVTAVDQDEHGVVVGTGAHEHRARWLVGCDGGRSAVRKLAGFDFVGTKPRFTGYIAQVGIADPEKLPDGMMNLTPNGVYMRLSSADHIGLMDFDGGGFDRSQPLTREHIQTVLRRVSGTDATVTRLHRASSFTDRAMQTTDYRRGRVLLAGDAAHIHSPVGGQGLNTGIGDAANLGWKLAATVTGTAPAGLLDTYAIERHPVAARVLEWSRAQVEILRPDPRANATRALIRELLSTPDGTTLVYRQVSGAAVRYDVGDDHPLSGRPVPDFHFGDGIGLGEFLTDSRGLVLDFTGDDRLRALAVARPALRYVCAKPENDLGLTALLVRPDGTVAWATTVEPWADEAGFTAAASRWFGEPPT